MDGGRRAHLAAKNTSVASPAHRSGWCGLLPLPEDRTLVEDHQLCGVCFDILRNVDWRRISDACDEPPRHARRSHPTGL